MRSLFIAFSVFGLLVFSSCGKNNGNDISDNTVVQQEDGTLALDLAEATCYNDKDDPASNTAEWKFVVSKPGRFKVWLSSATKDTTQLGYFNAVKISLLDNRLEVDPGCDKIVRNSDKVDFPYFRADSYMGSFYIPEEGEYTIQVISEKVLPAEAMNTISAGPDDTRLMSVILTPNIR